MKGVSSGSGGRANRVTSDNEGRKLVSFGFRVFSGSFGVTKLSDIYFILKITFYLLLCGSRTLLRRIRRYLTR